VITCGGVGVVVDDTTLLADVDLHVSPGEWVCVLGPNGAGKSTLIRAISGAADHLGEVALAGRPADGLRARERARTVALVPQTPVIPAGMAVDDYLLLGRTPHLRRFRTESAEDFAAVDSVVERLHLAALRSRPIESLSGGERQRVVLGLALVQDTPLLLLDEPTSALDIGHQQEVLELVDELRVERSLTVLSTMHDLTLAGQYADRLVLLAGGRVVAEGAASEVLTAEVLKAHFGVSVRIVHDDDGLSVLPLRRRPVR